MFQDKNRSFKLYRAGDKFKVDKDYHKPIVMCGWLNSQELDKYFHEMEEMTNYFDYLRSLDVYNNYKKMIVLYGSLIVFLFYVNKNKKVALIFFLILFSLLMLIIIFRYLHIRNNYKYFLYDIDLALRKVNGDFFEKKDLKLIYDIDKCELVVINIHDNGKYPSDIQLMIDRYNKTIRSYLKASLEKKQI